MAVITRKAFVNETITANTTVTTVDYYSKTYIGNPTSGTITLTLPFAGGGAFFGAKILVVNIHATNNVIVTYASGVSVTLLPNENALLHFTGSKWEVTCAKFNGDLAEDFKAKKFTTSDIVENLFDTGAILDCVKDYDSVTASVTGAIEIVLPAFTQGMFKLSVRLRSHHATTWHTDCILNISGLLIASTQQWEYVSSEILGKYSHDKIINYGWRTISAVKYPTIVIGNIADTWAYPKVQILSVVGPQNMFDASWLDRASYNINVIAALSGDYTSQSTIIPGIFSANQIIGDDGTSYFEILPEGGSFELNGNIKESAGVDVYKRTGRAVQHILGTDYAIRKAISGTAGNTIAGGSKIEWGDTFLKLFPDLANDAALHTYFANTGSMFLGIGRTADGDTRIIFRTAAGGTVDSAHIQRIGGTNGALNILNAGTGDMNFYRNSALAMHLQSGGAPVLDGDKFIKNLVVYDDTDVTNPSFTVTIPGAGASDVYLVMIQGKISNDSLGESNIEIHQGGTGGALKGSLLSFMSPDLGSIDIGATAIGIIVGTQFSITSFVTAGSSTILFAYTYMRIA